MPLEITQVAGHVPMHVLTEDAYELTPDGRRILVGRAGQSIPLARAQQLRIVRGGPEATPSEAKAPAAKTTKGKRIVAENQPAETGVPSAIEDPAEGPQAE